MMGAVKPKEREGDGSKEDTEKVEESRDKNGLEVESDIATQLAPLALR